MSYIEQSLGPHERLIARAYLPWLYRVFAYLVLIGGIALAAGAFFVLQERSAALVTAGVALSAALAAFVAIMIRVWTTEIAVTNQRLVFKRGWLRRSSDELELFSIEEVDWEQSLLVRVFGFGRLMIYGTGEEEMRLPLISGALAFRKAVQEAINEARQAPRGN
jgi:membrane protein YdbS with pleckstrin-like domain